MIWRLASGRRRLPGNERLEALIIFNVTHSIAILTAACINVRKFLIEGTKSSLKKVNEYGERSLMLVTSLSPVIGYDKASKVAHYALDNDLTLKAAALRLGFGTEAEFECTVHPRKMVSPRSLLLLRDQSSGLLNKTKPKEGDSHGN